MQLHPAKQKEVTNRFVAVKHILSAGSLYHFTRGTLSQELLHQIKYANYAQSAGPLGKYMAEYWRTSLADWFPFTVVPVPLHRNKKLERGYNQSELIGKSFAKAIDQKYNPNALTRIRHTKSQTKKSKNDRLKNVKGAFRINIKYPIQTPTVLLLDDVITSGATMIACIEAIDLCYPQMQYIIVSTCLAV